MDKFFNLFVLVQPFLPPPKMFVVPPSAVFGAIFFTWLGFRLISAPSRPHYPIQVCFFILFSWIFLVDVMALGRFRSWDELRHVMGRLVFFVFIVATYSAVRDQRQYRRALIYLMIGVLILAVYTIFSAVFNFDPFELMPRQPREYWGVSMGFRRTSGVPMSYGKYGLMVNAVLPLFLVSVWKKDFLVPRRWAVPAILLLFFALFVTQSRNAWVATACVLFFLGFIAAYRSHDILVKVTFLFGVVAAAIVAAIVFSDAWVFLFRGFTEVRHANTFYQRLESDALVFRLFLDNWVAGVGHAEITRQIAIQLKRLVVIHNGYLDQLASTGIIGFIPFISALAISFWTILKIAGQGAEQWRLYGLCLAASFVANIVVLLAYKGFFAETFAIEYGLMLSMLELNAAEKQKEVSYVAITPPVPSYNYMVRTGGKPSAYP